jgi:hypothetical protein
MRALVLALAITIAIAAGSSCTPVEPWECDVAADCIRDEVQGICTPYAYCAYPDESCAPAPHYRYDDTAGDDLSDVCVGNEEL